MLVDEAIITVKAGHGGAGKVSFFAMKSGPSGGNGGRGGDVYAVANNNIADLKRFVERITFQAARGTPGSINRQHGLNGENLYLQMPIGTTIIDLDTKEEIELTAQNREVFLCKGGIGGRGNDAFKTPTFQTPRRAEPGKDGQERRLKLILKLIADYGLIGLPNAGKSSLLNMLTAAHAKIANYPFTTLEPNLGVVKQKVVADIPGLIEGASSGKGLGINFLKHIEKVQLLLHCVAADSENVVKDYETVAKELAQYKATLVEKKTIILLTKVDLVSENEIKKKIKLLRHFDKDVLPVSIYNEDSIHKLADIL